MKIKGLRLSCAALISVCFLAACSRMEETGWTPDRTALEISEDGTVTETVIETLDKSYYSADELSTMISTEIGEYTSSHGEGTVVQTSLDTSDGTVTLVLTYASAEDYASFNSIAFFNGSMLGAEMAGYTFDSMFTAVEDGALSEEEISSDEPLSHKEYSVAVTDDMSHAINVPGKIRYVSEGAGLLNDYTAVPPSADSGSEDSNEDTDYFYVIYDF